MQCFQDFSKNCFYYIQYHQISTCEGADLTAVGVLFQCFLKKCCQAPISIFSPFLILVCHCHNSQYFDISCVCFISKLLIEFPNLFELIKFDEPGKNLTNLNSLCFLFFIQYLNTVNEFLLCDF